MERWNLWFQNLQVIKSLKSSIFFLLFFSRYNSHFLFFLFDNVDLKYNALSFIFLQVRELSWLQWHPFSVSSSPLDGKYHVSILIKVLGEWTAKLRESILNGPKEDPQIEQQPLQPHSNLSVSVEGPYGHESPYHLMYVFYSLITYMYAVIISFLYCFFHLSSSHVIPSLMVILPRCFYLSRTNLMYAISVYMK